MSEQLHTLAREVADKLSNPDKKQLRYNDIIQVAKTFYPSDVKSGVRELVASCDRSDQSLYVKKNSMHKTLTDQYGWMVSTPGENQ